MDASNGSFPRFAALCTTLSDIAAFLYAAALFPSALYPRGLLTFGVGGLGLLIVAWLMGKRAASPSGLRYVGYLSGVLLVL